MELHPGQPDNAFTAVQLESMGCGNDSSIRRRYFIKQGGLYTDDLLISFTVKNKTTNLIPYDLLTSQDREIVYKFRQAKYNAEILAGATELYNSWHPRVEVATSQPERPKLTSPAALAGAEAARKLKEKELKAIEDAKQRKQLGLAMFMQLPESSKQAAKAKHAMLEALESFLKAGCYKGRIKNGKQCWHWGGVEKFCATFMDGTLEIAEDVAKHFQKKGKRSLTGASLTNWRNQYDEQGMYGLGDHFVSTKGATILTALQQDFVISMIYDHPHATPRAVHKGMKARFRGEKLASVHTVDRFMKHWKATHISLYLFITNPDEWRNRHMFAFGNASEEVIRLNQRWEADSTPADVLCTDGRCCIIGIIDVWPRRLKLLVSPTSKAMAIGALYRRCLIDWGVLEEFRTDCGSDYSSFYIERVCDALDVYHHLCNEFHPEEKPHIERAFQTFSHGIVELLPGYIGHSVTDRKAIESRKTFAHRLMTKGETVDVKLTMAELQKVCDQWTESIYHQDPHSGLNGMTPVAKARSWTGPIKKISDERALDVLLYPAPSNDGWRVIGKKGLEVTFAGVKLYYKAAEFSGHEGERVRVLIDETDLGHASIFQADGSFLCVASDPVWYGISNQEVACHAKAKQKQVMAEQKKEIKQIAKQANTRDIAAEILKSRTEDIANIVEFPKKTETYSTSALEQASLAVAERERRSENPALDGIIELPPEVLESEAREAQKVIQIKQLRGQRMFADQYEISEDVRKRINQDNADEAEIEWLRTYEHYVATGKKTGRFADDPYLLKHWQQAEQAVGQ